MRLAAIASLLVVAAACSSTYGSAVDAPGATDGGTDATPTPPPSNDAGAADADTDVAGPKNLLLNGDFQAGCGGWVATNAKLTPLTSPTGNGFCRVCQVGAQTYFSIDQTTPLGPVPKGTWTFSVSLSDSPTDGGALSELGLSTFLLYDDGGFQPVADYTSGPSLDATWQTVTHVFVVGADSQSSIQASVKAKGPGCFLIDDAALYAPP